MTTNTEEDNSMKKNMRISVVCSGGGDQWAELPDVGTNIQIHEYPTALGREACKLDKGIERTAGEEDWWECVSVEAVYVYRLNEKGLRECTEYFFEDYAPSEDDQGRVFYNRHELTYDNCDRSTVLFTPEPSLFPEEEEGDEPSVANS